MSKFLTMLLGSTGGIMILVFALSLVFNADIAMKPLGITVGVIGMILVAVSWVLGETIRRRSNTSGYTLKSVEDSSVSR